LINLNFLTELTDPKHYRIVKERFNYYSNTACMSYKIYNKFTYFWTASNIEGTAVIDTTILPAAYTKDTYKIVLKNKNNKEELLIKMY